MFTIFWIALAVLITAGVVFKGKEKRSINARPSTSGFGIAMTDEEVELERQYGEEILKLLEARMIKSGFFKTEMVPQLVATLRQGYSPFGRTNTKAAFEGETMLTVQEKKALGLNIRMKYSSKFIAYFDPAALKSIEPKSTLSCMHLDVFHRVSRKRELRKLKRADIHRVKVVCVGDDGDCEKIKRLKKVYRIGEVPELPLRGCTADFCRCMYQGMVS